MLEIDRLELCYTVGIKRRVMPGYRKFTVFGHRSEKIGDSYRLVLKCEDGSLVAVPALAKKEIKVYPDYDGAIENQAKLKDKTEPPVEEVLDDGILTGQ